MEGFPEDWLKRGGILSGKDEISNGKKTEMHKLTSLEEDKHLIKLENWANETWSG